MKNKFRRAFIEITNECNLACGFCAVRTRPPAFMPVGMFRSAAKQTLPLAAMLSLHVMGEPFTHPALPELLAICSGLGLRVNLVTNGTLLDKFGAEIFKEKCLTQISFSLHALAALPAEQRAQNLRRLAEFAGTKPPELIVSFRLRGGKEDAFVKETAGYILKHLGKGPGIETVPAAMPLGGKVFLNSGELFQWPGQGTGIGKKGCLGLRHHFAILCTGEVTPCCADHTGTLSIGDMNKEPLADILNSPRAAALRDSIAGKTPMPNYCSACGFAAP